METDGREINGDIGSHVCAVLYGSAHAVPQKKRQQEGEAVSVAVEAVHGFELKLYTERLVS